MVTQVPEADNIAAVSVMDATKDAEEQRAEATQYGPIVLGEMFGAVLYGAITVRDLCSSQLYC